MVAARRPEDHEHRMGNDVRPRAGGRNGNSAGNPLWIELAQAVIRCDRVLAFPGLQNRRDVRVGQALVDAEISKSYPSNSDSPSAVQNHRKPRESRTMQLMVLCGRPSATVYVFSGRRAAQTGMSTEEPKRRTGGQAAGGVLGQPGTGVNDYERSPVERYG